MNKPIKIILVASIAGATGFALYKGYKYIKANKETVIEGEDLENELAAVKALKDLEHEHIDNGPDEDEEDYDGPETYFRIDPGDVPDNEEVYMDPEVNSFDEGEVEELRWPVNSDEAYGQYREMRLANIMPTNKARQVLYNAFSYPFDEDRVVSENDKTIIEEIHTQQEEFFGPDSCWTGHASYAELILYLMEKADFDFDRGYDYWAGSFIENLALGPNSSSTDLQNTFDDLGSHVYTNNKTGLFGIFGLNPNLSDQWKQGFMVQYWAYADDYAAKLADES